MEGCWETWWERHWGMLEKPQNFAFKNKGYPKNIMNVRKINVLVGEN
jgi:hypothetical protein